jgi:3-hydroxybutyryl-CoA dehydrogenase
MASSDNILGCDVPSTVGVVGGGTMGVGIAYVFAVAGWSTTIVEPDDDRAEAVRRTVTEAAANGAARGKLDPDRAAELPSLVRRVRAVSELPAGLGLVVETVPERLELKHRVLAEIEATGPQIIATNTSALSVNVLADAITDRVRFLGMHFFNPVWSLPLVELVRATETSDATIAAAQQIVTAIGKQSITVHDAPGFATSRLDLIAGLEAMRMLEDGVASAEDIDRAVLLAYRHPIGPLRLSDVVGLDVRLDIARVLAASLGDRYAPPQILIDKVAAGELGQKTGRGFFDWPTELRQ